MVYFYHKSWNAGGSSYCYCDYYVFYLVLAGDNEPFRVAPSAFNGYYRYPVSGGSAFTAEFFFSFFLFTLHLFVSVSLSLCVCASVYN